MERKIYPLWLILFMMTSIPTFSAKNIDPAPGQARPMEGSLQQKTPDEQGTVPAVTFDIKEHSLDNGMKVLMLEDHSAPMVTFQIHYMAGSRNEKPGITGISHLFEHMMFKGSKNIGPEEHARIVQSNGGSLNAFTTTDNTSYFQVLPADKLEIAMKLEAERMENLTITEEKLTSEREVVRNERKMRTVNTPYGLAEEVLMSTMFDRHPYQWPVIGWDSDLKAISVDDCIEYFRKYYAPDNATAVIVGDFKTDEALELMRKYFGHLKPQGGSKPVPTYEAPQRGEKRVIFKKFAQASALFAGFHIPSLNHPDTPALQVISAILTKGESSRFYQKFIKTGKAGTISTNVGIFFPTKDPSLFSVSAIANPGVNIDEIEKGIWEELDKLKTEGLAPEELEKAKRQNEASFIFGLQSLLWRGVNIGILQLRGNDFRRINTYAEEIRKLTSEDIKRTVAKYFGEDNRTVVTVIPVSIQESERYGRLE
ncbi:MAG: pitrilysin family protein [Acidobacteriota bacterium]